MKGRRISTQRATEVILDTEPVLLISAAPVTGNIEQDCGEKSVIVIRSLLCSLFGLAVADDIWFHEPGRCDERGCGWKNGALTSL